MNRFRLASGRPALAVLLTGGVALGAASVAAPRPLLLLVLPALGTLAASTLGRWPWTATVTGGTVVALAAIAAASGNGPPAVLPGVQGLLLLAHLTAAREAEHPAGRAAENDGRRPSIYPAAAAVLATTVVLAAAGVAGIGSWPVVVVGAAALATAFWIAVDRPSEEDTAVPASGAD